MMGAVLYTHSKTTPRETLPAAAKALAGLFALSPGMSQALGLGNDPVARLLEYAALSTRRNS